MAVVPSSRRSLTRRQLLAATGAAGLALVVAGCGGGAAAGPPKIVVGRTQCDHCHMIITELRFAGAYRTADGDEHRFDDIGDMIEYAQLNGELEGSRFWVFDYDSEDPIDATAATFVHSETLATPMDWALAAFGGRAAAERFVAGSSGDILSWDEVLDHVGRAEHDPHH